MWETILFKDFIKLNRGFDLPNDKIQEGDIPVVASTSIKGYHNEFKVKAPCVVTGRSGSLGFVQYVNKDCWPLNTTLYVKDYKGNNPMFVYYYLKTMHLEIFNSGAGVPTLNQNHLHFIRVKVPPLPTQQKIADILSAYDDLIENNNRRIELLEQAAQQLYKEWFVRFRFPGYEKVHFTNGLPDGWEVVKLGDEINITSSKRIFLSDYVEKGIPFYRSKEVIQLAEGQAITEPLFIEEAKYIEIKERFGVPIKNDILLTSVGTIGISLLIKNDNPFYFKDGNLTWLQSSVKPFFALYLYLWLKSDSGKQQILSSAIGTSQSALTIETLKNNKILRPKENVLIEFSKIIKPINLQLEKLQQKNQNLIKQRDILLPRLMSGKLEV